MNYDIYAIGLQEIIDLNNPLNTMFDINSYNQSAIWRDHLCDCLNSSINDENSNETSPESKMMEPPCVQYVLLSETNLVGMGLYVFARSTIINEVSDIRWSRMGVGFLGVMGNKGAVGVSFVLFDTPLCFICSHFSAGRENVDRRKLDFHNIIANMQFVAATPFATPSNSSATAISTDSIQDDVLEQGEKENNNVHDKINDDNDDDDDNEFKKYQDGENEYSFFSEFLSSTISITSSAFAIAALPYVAISDVLQTTGVNNYSTFSSSQYRRSPQAWQLSYDFQKLENRSIYTHEIIFWLGDLNFHLHQSLSYEDIFSRIETENFESLQQWCGIFNILDFFSMSVSLSFTIFHFSHSYIFSFFLPHSHSLFFLHVIN